MEDYPILDRNDCPNKLYSLLRTEIKASEQRQSNQLHDYHMELLSVKQRVVDHGALIKLGGLAIVIIVVIILII